MPLIVAKCTNCGGVLSIDDDKEAAICPFCGSAFIVEKAIQNFYTTNKIYAENLTIQNIENDFKIEAGLLVKYKGASKNVIIPDNVDTISSTCFSGMGIETVTMNGNVKKIGGGAFKNCTQLKNVCLSDYIYEIYDDTFCGCSNLCTINTPKYIKYIGKNAFAGCDMLEDFSFMPNMTLEIGAFKDTLIKKPKIQYPIIIPGIKNKRYQDDLWSIYFMPDIIQKENIAYVEINNENELNNFFFEISLIFGMSPYGNSMIDIAVEQMKTIRKQHNLCQHCGNSFLGIFMKKCSVCGKNKDY